EQGRPVIEKFLEQNSDYQLLLTFFSPSGYEIRKNYDKAIAVSYLPLDTARNARKFLEIVKPSLVFFVKYEHWVHYIRRVKKNLIPLYLISAVFRNNQVFFRWYGGWYRKQLMNYSGIFVQNEESVKLASGAGIGNVIVSGDTRFDRVREIYAQEREIPLIKKFAGNKIVITAGSTWKEDEEILMDYLNRSGESMKLLIAPHEVGINNIKRLKYKAGDRSVLLSEAEEKDLANANCLIIDSIGLLSFVYRYGTVAYIGGGFGKGIHNVLEAAVFGLPVFFGPQYKRFREANELIAERAAFPVNGKEEFCEKCSNLLRNPEELSRSGKSAYQYVEKNAGAVSIILDFLKKNPPDC
ncbi:MAG: glycosyltransferase N-terminal domain-containing protein, partial [Bacteroidota bacterium]